MGGQPQLCVLQALLSGSSPVPSSRGAHAACRVLGGHAQLIMKEPCWDGWSASALCSAGIGFSNPSLQVVNSSLCSRSCTGVDLFRTTGGKRPFQHCRYMSAAIPHYKGFIKNPQTL